MFFDLWWVIGYKWALGMYVLFGKLGDDGVANRESVAGRETTDIELKLMARCC